MKYYSTNRSTPEVGLSEAVVKGLAADNGLYMPEQINRLPQSFFDNIDKMSFQEMAYQVASALFGEDIPAEDLKEIVYDTLAFDTPLVEVTPRAYALELFHGPTLAFKDVGARFMARMLRYFLAGKSGGKTVNVLVATSGDTGSAVANGFLGVEGIKVHVLYPKGKVSAIQECQFTTLGKNITALEVDGTFDDCQALVKKAFLDEELNRNFLLTSANSINVARFLPQAFYYFNAYAQLKRIGKQQEMVVAVPSGNFGNLSAALIAKRMGLPIKRFIAGCNSNRPFPDYIATGVYTPRASVATIANAMDVGAPSNFARILDLYGNSHESIASEIASVSYDDTVIADTMRQCYKSTGYILDPHGAVAFKALEEGLQGNENGVFLETAHPAKFKSTVDEILDIDIELPKRLEAFTKGKKQSVEMTASFDDFAAYLRKAAL